MHSKPPFPFDAYAQHISALEQRLKDLQSDLAKSLGESRQLYEGALTSSIEREQRTTALLDHLAKQLNDCITLLEPDARSHRANPASISPRDELAINHQRIAQELTKLKGRVDEIDHRLGPR